MHDEFLCHVTGYGTCGGRRIGVPLGTYRAPTLALALWWLRDRAAWIADRLDPQPESEHLPAGALVPVADTVLDVPAVLGPGPGTRTNRRWSPTSWPRGGW